MSERQHSLKVSLGVRLQGGDILPGTELDHAEAIAAALGFAAANGMPKIGSSDFAAWADEHSTAPTPRGMFSLTALRVNVAKAVARATETA